MPGNDADDADVSRECAGECVVDCGADYRIAGDSDEDDECNECCNDLHWPHYRFGSQRGWQVLWKPLMVYGVWFLLIQVLLTSSNPGAPLLATALFLVGLILACLMPTPGRNAWILGLPWMWFSSAFPGSYCWFWAVYMPLPSQTGIRMCLPTEVFGTLVSATGGLPVLVSSSPYLRGECADPVCGFVFSWDRKHERRRPIFASRSGNISGSEQLSEACHNIVDSNGVTGSSGEQCTPYCAELLEGGQRWRFSLHYLLPFCSIVAGWGPHDGGAAYMSCGMSALSITHLASPGVMFSIAVLYSLPMLLVLALELWHARQEQAHPEAGSLRLAPNRTLDPSPTRCLPDGRFVGGTMYFPYSCLPVSSDVHGEKLSCFLDAVWVIPDVPSDIMTTLVYLRTGRVHHAMMVLAGLLFVGDPLQLKAATALTSRWRNGFPSRRWWEYRGEQGTCESALSAALAISSLATASPSPTPGALLRILTLAYSAGTSLLAVSAAAEAHALLHLADYSTLELRDYYMVMRVRKCLGYRRAAAILRVLSSSCAAGVCELAGRPELALLNVAAVLLEALARDWDSRSAERRLSLVTQACRYFCLITSLVSVLCEGLWDWQALSESFGRCCSWHSLPAAGMSLSKAGFLLMVGPMAVLANPAADIMDHKTFSALKISFGSQTAQMEADVDSSGPDKEDSEEQSLAPPMGVSTLDFF